LAEPDYDRGVMSKRGKREDELIGSGVLRTSF
jgi:hypothetical protein